MIGKGEIKLIINQACKFCRSRDGPRIPGQLCHVPKNVVNRLAISQLNRYLLLEAEELRPEQFAELTRRVG